MKRVLIGLGVLLLVSGAGAALYFWREQGRIADFARTPYGAGSARRVEVPPGTGPRTLGTLLAQAGVVGNAEDFYAYVRRERIAPKLKAGEYEFAPPLTPAQVVEKLVSGQVKVYRFTVPEGLRIEEILPILASSELQLNLGKLNALAADKAFVRKTGVPAPAENFEGFLYPDTYLFNRPFTEESVLKKMVSRSLEEYRTADALRKPGTTLDLLETMTLASIVEKETAAVEERPRISCVFHNRLRLKMRLGTDPTVIYAKRLWSGVYSKNITHADLLTRHPYNTYTEYGLPPGPIANAGAAAIQATLNPLSCTDLYFVSRNNGTHVFCPDLQCHNAAVKKWQIDFFKQQKH